MMLGTRGRRGLVQRLEGHLRGLCGALVRRGSGSVEELGDLLNLSQVCVEAPRCPEDSCLPLWDPPIRPWAYQLPEPVIFSYRVPAIGLSWFRRPAEVS